METLMFVCQMFMLYCLLGTVLAIGVSLVERDVLGKTSPGSDPFLRTPEHYAVAVALLPLIAVPGLAFFLLVMMAYPYGWAARKLVERFEREERKSKIVGTVTRPQKLRTWDDDDSRRRPN